MKKKNKKLNCDWPKNRATNLVPITKEINQNIAAIAWKLIMSDHAICQPKGVHVD